MLKFSDYISNMPDIPHQNFAQLLEQVARDHAGKDAILYRSGGQREFTRWSFSKYSEECRRIAQGLLAVGLVKGDRVVLWAENRPEWMAVWMGAVIAGLSIVPVDFLVTEQECLNIINITRAKAFFHSAKKQEFAESLDGQMAVTVCISPKKHGGESEFYDFGKNASGQALPDANSIAPDHSASIVFTSGTTGVAKGVTLSHKNIIANAGAAIRILEPNSSDVFLDVLPLHHTYPTTCCFIAPISFGIPTVIVDRVIGDVIRADARDAGVTFFIGVPLLFDKFMIGAAKKITGIKKLVLSGPRKKALALAKQGKPEFGQGHKLLKKVRAKFDLASVRLMIAGGGPLNPATADFFDSLGFNIVQGYGMSENSPLITVNTPRHKRNESVGLPVSYTKVKIFEPNEEGIGEIGCTSPSVMIGYFENEEATNEVIKEIDGERWLFTGDLGKIDDDGFVHILGRKKNLIVTAAGKNIYPEEIEVLFSSRIIAEILVVGRRAKDGSGESIFAVVVPNYENIKEDFPGKESNEEFIQGEVRKLVEEANRKLPPYKKISDFTLRKEPFEKNAQQKIRRFLYKEYENA
ncbi:MAG: AMP-binding protein [Treponema sp.]|nr:AMP-binding protein [Treponema sp.]